MNHKQKLGYMALGAGILAIGIIIGQVVTPDIEAQSNGVFDKIQCREIEVIDKDGKTAIRLHTTKHGGDIRMDSKDGRIATMSIDENGGSVFLSGKGKGSGGTVSMFTREDSASLSVHDRLLSDRGISMFATEFDGVINLKGEGGKVAMYATIHDGRVAVYSKDRGEAEMRTEEHGGRIRLLDKRGKIKWQSP